MLRRSVIALMLLIGGGVSAADSSFVSLESSATNLIVTEKFTLTVTVMMPPSAENPDLPPWAENHPPRFIAEFLDSNWNCASVPKGIDGIVDFLNGLITRTSTPERPAWLINQYKSNDPFADFDDPFGMFGNRRRDTRIFFSIPCDRVDRNGSKWWRWRLTTPEITAEKTGEISFDAVGVEIPVIVKGAEGKKPVLARRSMLSNRIKLTVSQPPLEGRPVGYTGVIASDVKTVAHLDTSVCRRGDPLILTVEVSGKGDLSRATPPKLAAQINQSGYFKVDDDSIKTETFEGGRRLIYRVRAVKAGTTEFPTLRFSHYDLTTHSYVPTATEPIPLQVLPGDQVALGEVDKQDRFPLPDGLYFDESAAAPKPLFPTWTKLFGIKSSVKPNGFTWRRASSSALQAIESEDWAKVAEIYKSMIDAGIANPEIYCNLGAAQVMSGAFRPAIASYSRAERWTGVTPTTRRGIRAAYAGLFETARPALPPERLLGIAVASLTWEQWSFVLVGIIPALILLIVVFRVVRRFGVRKSVKAVAILAALALFPFGPAEAKFGFDGVFGMGQGIDPEKDVTASIAVNPAVTLAGEMCELVLKVSCAEGVTLEPSTIRLSVNGEFPSCISDVGAFSQYADGTQRIPMRFNQAGEYTLNFTLSAIGSINRVTKKGNFSSTVSMSGQRVQKTLEPLKVVVAALPDEGRPVDFAGAIGTSFRFTQVAKPKRVRPGDLVTVTYTLDYNGYCPTNIVPSIVQNLESFKRYEIKNVLKDRNRFQWTQVMIPLSEAATNTDEIAISWFDNSNRVYRAAIAAPVRLEFKSKDEVDVENDVVVSSVRAKTSTSGGETAAVRTLLLVPADGAAVVASAPVDDCRETGEKYGEWRRYESSAGAGWSR